MQIISLPTPMKSILFIDFLTIHITHWQVGTSKWHLQQTGGN